MVRSVAWDAEAWKRAKLPLAMTEHSCGSNPGSAPASDSPQVATVGQYRWRTWAEHVKLASLTGTPHGKLDDTGSERERSLLGAGFWFIRSAKALSKASRTSRLPRVRIAPIRLINGMRLINLHMFHICNCQGGNFQRERESTSLGRKRLAEPRNLEFICH